MIVARGQLAVSGTVLTLTDNYVNSAQRRHKPIICGVIEDEIGQVGQRATWFLDHQAGAQLREIVTLSIYVNLRVVVLAILELLKPWAGAQPQSSQPLAVDMQAGALAHNVGDRWGQMVHQERFDGEIGCLDNATIIRPRPERMGLLE